MENNLQENEQKDLLSDADIDFDTSAYDAKVKKARNWLFAVAVIQLISGLVDTFQSEEEVRMIVIAIHLPIVLAFTGLALWSNKKPYPALLTAIILFVVVYIGFGILDPMNFVRGVIIKIFVLVALVNGIKAAKEAEQIRNIRQ